MSLTVPSSSNSVAISDVIHAGNELVKVAKYIYKNLPDTRKERNQARSEFERKLMGPKSQAKNKGNSQKEGNAIQDVSRASGSSKAMVQRSLTSSYAMGKGGGGGKRNKQAATQRWKISFNGLLALSNNGAATSAGQFVQAINQSLFAGAPTLGTVTTQAAALAGIFREYRITKVRVNFVPRVATTVTGSIGVCFDRDPRAGTTTSMGVIVRKNPYFEVDLKQPGYFEWTPVDEEDRRWRYTVDGARPQENLSFGSIIWYSQNSLALGDFVGDLAVDIDYEFAVTY